MSLIRTKSPISSYLRSTRGPVSLVLEGALLILIGVVIAVLNANNTGHIQKVSGRIDSVDNTGSTLTLAGQQDLYNYVQSDFNTSWVPNAGDQVVLHYEDTTPKLIVAIQEYDQSGHLIAQAETASYQQNPNTYAKPGIPLGVPIAIIVVGVLLAAVGVYRLVRYRMDR